MQCGQWPIWQWRLLIQAWTMMPVWCTMWVKVSVAWQWQVWIGTLTRYRCWEIMTLSLDWGQWHWASIGDNDNEPRLGTMTLSLDWGQWHWASIGDNDSESRRWTLMWVSSVINEFGSTDRILPKYLEELTWFFQNIWKNWHDSSKIFGRNDKILPKYLEEMTRFFQNIWKIQMQLCCGCCCGLNPLFKPLPFSPNLP